MYKLKQAPEDFIVKEICKKKIFKTGRYTYFKVIKKNRNTLDVAKELAKQLHLKEKQIGFAGSKDKHAVTEQVFSAVDISKERLSLISLENVKITYLGRSDEPICLGELEGNEFIITVRNLEQKNLKKTALQQIKFIPNYFDEQRFSEHNVEIGRYLLKKEFKKALNLITEKKSIEYLQQNKNDFIGALKQIPLRLLRMYINADQSYLWNLTLAEFFQLHGEIIKEVPYSIGKFIFVKNEERFKGLKLPVIGFACEKFIDKKTAPIIRKIMEQEKINYTDFIIRQIPELSLEGELRQAIIEVKNLIIDQPKDDELNPGKQQITLSFYLRKGSYATLVVKRIFD